ncbi:hypothetical protein HPG69_011896 [Diceros bicornis minor]|uniref:Uncharacterized protein n=1 Tax=Diceros bicornis minor TaxID=77932 RepID=A0A7J7ES89_DICBM|nr:hypothetical protein HPG69_011896 [Diceros bicornis minor]
MAHADLNSSPQKDDPTSSPLKPAPVPFSILLKHILSHWPERAAGASADVRRAQVRRPPSSPGAGRGAPASMLLGCGSASHTRGALVLASGGAGSERAARRRALGLLLLLSAACLIPPSTQSIICVGSAWVPRTVPGDISSLSLVNGTFSEIKDRMFSHLPSLQLLLLNSNSFTAIRDDAFAGLFHLEYLVH